MPVLYSAMLFQPGALPDGMLEEIRLDTLRTDALTQGLDPEAVSGLTLVFEGSIEDAQSSEAPEIADNVPDFLRRGDYDAKAMAGMRLAIHSAHTTEDDQ
ncbi:hypothetical protein AWB98_01250 [Mycolicibacterium conceptionense]|uniref:Uncharacterized protein n=1 Tax=Mycolicibacterium conceptionense TaxID=451644 RepID=A0ABX3V0N8_9MYCO|nr:hypothetical protein [Mycolicibacterium conceptionense]ORV20954.1 hypothetical protein AWB98_01250 [Mycolicibacterium conceptionense]